LAADVNGPAAIVFADRLEILSPIKSAGRAPGNVLKNEERPALRILQLEKHCLSIVLLGTIPRNLMVGGEVFSRKLY
jgi:hypothetical protein